MLTAMRGELIANPELRTTRNPKSGQELKVVDATITYRKDEKSTPTYVRIEAWEKQAEELAAKKKGDVIEFAGKLTYNDYKTPTMERPHKALGFSVSALDEAGTLCKKLEEFMGVERLPFDKPGAIFQPMRGKLYNDPVLTQITGKDGQPLDVCNVTLRYWNGKRGEKDAYVPISAYGETARMLGGMKKDDSIQFVGRLDSRPYTNEKMDRSHMELCYTAYSIDPEHNLLKNTEDFIREQMDLRRSFNELVQDAEERKSAVAPTKETRELETAK